MKLFVLIACLFITLGLGLSSCLYSNGNGYPGTYGHRSYWKKHNHYTRNSHRPRDYNHAGHHYGQYR